MMASPEVTPDEARTVGDGCAIVSFGLDSTGRITDPAVELERPANVGVGAAAVSVLSRNVYAANGENLFGNQVPTGAAARFAVTVGFAHEDGHLAVAFRTPFSAHPVAADRGFSSQD